MSGAKSDHAENLDRLERAILIELSGGRAKDLALKRLRQFRKAMVKTTCGCGQWECVFRGIGKK